VHVDDHRQQQRVCGQVVQRWGLPEALQQVIGTLSGEGIDFWPFGPDGVHFSCPVPAADEVLDLADGETAPAGSQWLPPARPGNRADARSRLIDAATAQPDSAIEVFYLCWLRARSAVGLVSAVQRTQSAGPLFAIFPRASCRRTGHVRPHGSLAPWLKFPPGHGPVQG
jgi:hypothetical protein